MAVPLSGGLISARAAERVSGVPAAAGLARIGQLHHVRTGGLIAMLDAGGYARCDFRTAARLLEPSGMAGERDEGQVTVTGRSFAAYLPPRAGWGRSARLGPGERAVTAARPLEVTSARLWGEGLAGLTTGRGLECRLVWLERAHGRAVACCPAGQACTALRRAGHDCLG